VLSQWVNDSEFAGAVRLHPKSKDPMIGTQDPAREHVPDQDHRASNLCDDEGSRVLLSPECHRHQVHRQLGVRTDGDQVPVRVLSMLFLTRLFGNIIVD
jgi:hypothetical protein